MKKLISILLSLLLLVGLCACGVQINYVPEDPKEGEELKSPTAEEIVRHETIDTSVVDRSTGIPTFVELYDTDVLQGKKIGCSIVFKGDEWCASLANALELLGAYYGAEIVVEDGDLNDETQTKQIENMIANDVDIIFCDPVTPDGCNVVLNQAHQAGIPIVIFDGYWAEGEEKAISTITWDQYETGFIVSDYLMEHLREEGKDSVRILELALLISTHCQERFHGLHDAFEQVEDIDITIVDQLDTQGNRELAYNAVSAVVEPYDYIIADIDNSAMGAVAALQAAGNTGAKVISMDAYGTEAFLKLRDGDPNYLAFLKTDTWLLAQYTLYAAIGYYMEEEVPPVINIPLHMVDADNYDQFWTFEETAPETE